jgi:hypothetical protein
MIHALPPLNHQTPDPTPDTPSPTCGQDNPAVARCEEEWHRVYQALLKKKKSDAQAMEVADWAYREAMPAPVGYSNICNFIACVIYGMMMGRFTPEEGPKLLYGAQVALSTIAPQAKTHGRNSPTPDPKPETRSLTPLPPSPSIFPHSFENK